MYSQAYNYNNLDEFLSINRTKTAYINVNGAKWLYDKIKNVAIVQPEQLEQSKQIQSNQSNQTPPHNAKIWDVFKSDSNIQKLDEQQFKNLLLSINSYLLPSEINAIYNYILNNGGVVSKIGEDKFSVDIAGLEECKFKEDWKNKVRELFSNDNLKKMDDEGFKFFSKLKQMSYTDALKNGLIDRIKKNIPGYGKEFTIAEVRVGFLEAQQEQPKQEIENNQEQSELSGNIPSTENKEKVIEYIQENLFQDFNQYNENKEQYDTLISKYYKNSEKRTNKLNETVDAIIDNKFNDFKSKLDKDITTNNYKNLESLLGPFFKAAFSETVNEVLNAVVKRSTDLNYKNKIRGNIKDIRKVNRKFVKEALQYLIFTKIKEYLGVSNG